MVLAAVASVGRLRSQLPTLLSSFPGSWLRRSLRAWGGVLYLIQGTLDAATALRFSFVALAVLIGIPVSMLVTYVTTRGVKNKMFRELAEKQRLFREHLRMHDESPRWHIIIRTPEDARKKRASILEVISSYVKEVVDDELTRRTLMREQQEP